VLFNCLAELTGNCSFVEALSVLPWKAVAMFMLRLSTVYALPSDVAGCAALTAVADRGAESLYPQDSRWHFLLWYHSLK